MIFASGKEKAALNENQSSSGSEAPPAYPGPSSSSPPPNEPSSSRSPSGSAPPTAPPTSQASKNFVHIDSPHTAIKDTFYIDPSLRIPPWMLPPLESGRFTRPNLSLKSRDRSIDAIIHLLPSATEPSAASPEQSSSKRVILEASSPYGSVTVAVPVRNGHKFYLKVASDHGTIIVRLPPDFHGPIRYTTETHNNTNRIRFTPALRERMSILTQGGKVGNCFVGEWSEDMGPRGESGPGGSTDENAWEGDEVDVTGGHGKIKFCLWGEVKDESEGQMALRHLKEDGPIVSIVKLLKRAVEAQINKSSQVKA